MDHDTLRTTPRALAPGRVDRQDRAMAALDARFSAAIEKDGSFATFLTVPDSAELLGTRRAVKVAGTLDGHEFAATLMPSGSGPHWLPLRAALCKTLGKGAAGEVVDVHLTERFT